MSELLGVKYSDEFEKVDLVINTFIDKYEKLLAKMPNELKTNTIIPNHLGLTIVNIRDILTQTRILFDFRKGTSEENLALRSLALLIYEYMDDTKDFLGKKMRTTIEQIIPNKEQNLKELNFLKFFYYSLRENSIKRLADIRHHTIAHKTQDIAILSEKIKGISRSEILNYLNMIIYLLNLSFIFSKNLLNSYIHQEDKIIPLKSVLLSQFIISLLIEIDPNDELKEIHKE